MKHTPGPWELSTGDDGAVVYDDHATIANVPDTLIAWPDNARLIAAAPELLQLLEDCGEVLAELADKEHAELNRSLLQRVRAVIAKAKGETNQ